MTIRQLHLPGPPPGEATLITSPDGTTLLIDVGAGPHDDLVRSAAGGPVDLLLITHEDVDHVGALDDLVDVVGGAERVRDLGSWDLGGGASLEVFLADGHLRLPGGDIDLRDSVEDLDASDNARSLGGFVRWGDFVYVFAGDLTGGGKGTPDVETAVASHGADLLSEGDADVVHLNHHGISSSTNEAWVAWLLPDDGLDRAAVVGANRGYLAAPHPDVVERVGPRLGDGYVHVTRAGGLSEEHPSLLEWEADVVLSVWDGGAQYAVCANPHEST